MKAHLRKHFMRMSEHHATKAEHHASLAEHHRTLGEALQRATATSHAKIAKEIAALHDAAADEHREVSAHCDEVAKAFSASSKALGMHADELEPLPQGLSAIAPDAPGTARIVTRTGGAPLPALGGIDPALQKLFAIDEGEQL